MKKDLPARNNMRYLFFATGTADSPAAGFKDIKDIGAGSSPGFLEKKRSGASLPQVEVETENMIQ
ncbi:MAG TPA: hypothetical protein VJZ71_01990 [Phycisphaerae bacterium]|nr:hypothetical protein [Phycisphaerae bacterium]